MAEEILVKIPRERVNIQAVADRLDALAGELIVEAWIQGAKLTDEDLEALFVDAAARMAVYEIDPDDQDGCARLAEEIVAGALKDGRLQPEAGEEVSADELLEALEMV